MLDLTQSELGSGQGTYITIAKFSGLGECCFVIALLSALYVYTVEYLVHLLFQWTSYMNVTVLQKCSGNGHARLFISSQQPGYGATTHRWMSRFQFPPYTLSKQAGYLA